MRVIALERFEYANKLRLPGDEFDTDNDEHARLLALVKRVRIATDDDVIVSRDLKSDDEPPRKPNPYRDKYRDKYRNRYNHRAMRADE